MIECSLYLIRIKVCVLCMQSTRVVGHLGSCFKHNNSYHDLLRWIRFVSYLGNILKVDKIKEGTKRKRNFILHFSKYGIHRRVLCTSVTLCKQKLFYFITVERNYSSPFPSSEMTIVSRENFLGRSLNRFKWSFCSNESQFIFAWRFMNFHVTKSRVYKLLHLHFLQCS